MRRAALALAVLVLLGGAAVGAYVLLRERAGRDVRGSSTIEFVTTQPPAPPPRPPVAPPIPWAMFGRIPERQSVGPAGSLRPPLRRVWAAGGRALIEFPPSVAYGRLFFGDGAGHVVAVSASTGQRAWLFDARRGIAATPAVGTYKHGTVYEAFLNRFPSRAKDPADGEVIALEAGTGRVRWRTAVGASETSPLLADGRVYVGGWDGKVYALDERTGALAWTFQTNGAVKGGLAASGGRVFAGSYDGHLYALDAATGRRVWRGTVDPRLFGHGTFYATPVVAYGRVYVGSTDGKIYSFGATTGERRWSHSTGGYVYGSAAVWRERVLVGSYDGSFYAFDAATGAERWRFAANGPISGSATVIDGVVWFATLRGRSYALDARDGRLLWTFADGKYAPAVTDGKRIFLVGYGTVYGMTPR